MSDIWNPSKSQIIQQDLLYHPAMSLRNPKVKVLPEETQQLLTRMREQSEKWHPKPYFEANVADRRIALINDYHLADRLLNCAMVQDKYTGRPYSRCKLPWFCPYCGYLRGQDQLKKYGPAWEPGMWYWLVFSIRDGICLADPDHDTLSEVWDAMRACIKRLDEAFVGYQGYVAWEELAVYCFWPASFWTPHVNVLIKSTTGPDVVAFNQIVDDEWKCQERHRPGTHRLAARPDPVFSGPRSEAHFYEQLRYVKPIDLLTPYDTGHTEASRKRKLLEFHQEVRSFFDGYRVEAFIDQPRMIKNKEETLRVERRHYYAGGTCHGSSGEPIGVPKEIRWTKDHQNAVRERVQLAREEEKSSPDYLGCVENEDRGE